MKKKEVRMTWSYLQQFIGDMSNDEEFRPVELLVDGEPYPLVLVEYEGRWMLRRETE